MNYSFLLFLFFLQPAFLYSMDIESLKKTETDQPTNQQLSTSPELTSVYTECFITGAYYNHQIILNQKSEAEERSAQEPLFPGSR